MVLPLIQAANGSLPRLRIGFEKTSLLPQTARRDLGRGERAVLSYALHHDCTAILDERTARRYARSHSLKVHGTLGILLLAKREKHIERVRPHLDALQKVGFRINRTLRREVLHRAGEK